jgi:glycosyltransferase involved in cell wall biosynthesis
MLNYDRSFKPKVLLLTKQRDMSPTGGRELLCKLNHDALREIYGERLVLFELPRRPLQGISSVLSAFKGHIDGLDESIIDSALQIIQRENVGKVFVDGSNLGGFVKAVKARLPQVEISTFFHNVEARFFLGAFRQNSSLRSFAVMIVNYLAERKSVKYSDKIICLNERDSLLLLKVYGRKATHISAMALLDKLPTDFANNFKPSSERFALFVGGDFYANREGILWFVKNVVPRIDIKIYIVGRGFEKLRNELERDNKVVVVGAVDSLSEWYLNAQFVIAPIFDGSGMKTKVAEALMFGKKVVGTPEAFAGYEDIANHVGRLCETAEQFVTAIKTVQNVITLNFDPSLRAIYEEKYSYSASKARLASILRSQWLNQKFFIND